MQVPTYFDGQTAGTGNPEEDKGPKGPRSEEAEVRRGRSPKRPKSEASKRREGRQVRSESLRFASRRPFRRLAISPFRLLRSQAPSLLWPSLLRSSALGPFRRYGFFAVESVVAIPASFDWIDCAFVRCAWIVGCAFVINALSDVSCAAVLAVCSRFSTD